MFGVIVCPRCTAVQGVDLSTARSTCCHCGAKIDVLRAKVYFSTDSQRELAEGVRQVSGQISYDIEDVQPQRPKGPRAKVPQREKAKADEIELRSLASALTREKGDFGREELAMELEMEGEDLDKLLDRMLSTGIIYESSAGRYRAV